VHQFPFICERATITLVSNNDSCINSIGKRKRLKLKRIVISEHNYLALKRLGQAGDSFNDVVSKLLQVYRAYKEEKKQDEQQQQENDYEKYITNNSRLPFPDNLSKPCTEQDIQQLAGLRGLRKGNKGMNMEPIKEESE
jgi:predicted CopG family antitoxin